MLQNKNTFVNILVTILVAITIFTIAVPVPVLAQGGNVPQEGEEGPCAGKSGLGNCIVAIYRWALGVSVLIAMAMIVFSGYTYMTAGGDANKVAQSKERFAQAFIGLIILFAAVVILRTINPDLVNFVPI